MYCVQEGQTQPTIDLENVRVTIRKKALLFELLVGLGLLELIKRSSREHRPHL